MHIANIQQKMIADRAGAAEAGFASVRKSLVELLGHAQGTGVCLGIENRYHYNEIPSPDELQVLLSLAGSDRIGFLYDSGHAETLDCLGFYPHEEWLMRFGMRIVGTHLHDVIGTTRGPIHRRCPAEFPPAWECVGRDGGHHCRSYA